MAIEAGSNLQVHSFGPKSSPDSEIARQIAASTGILHERIETPTEDAISAYRRMYRFCSQHPAMAPASKSLDLALYDELNARNVIVVDGGFGEIGRCRYARRLRLPGAKLLASNSNAYVARCLRSNRPLPFIADINAALRRCFEADVEQARNFLANRHGSWHSRVDRLMIEFRLPNYYGYGQTAIDQIIQGLMPFAQPSFLSRVLAAPSHDRVGGRKYHKLLRSKNLGDDQFEFVKSESPLRIPNDDKTSAKAEPLKLIEPIVRELVRSSSVRNFEWYDSSALIKLSDAYYAGATELSGELDWWLSFELWRQSLTNSKTSSL